MMLEGKTREELYELATEGLGLKVHHNLGKGKLIKLIEKATSDGAASAEADSIPEEKAKAIPLPEEPTEEPKHTAKQNLAPIPRSNDYSEATVKTLEEALIPYKKRGMLVLKLDESGWKFRHGIKEDSGTIKQSLAAILNCADKLLWCH